MAGRKLLKCSFCGKNETQVAKLVAGPRVYICNECVSAAAKLMEEDPSNQASGSLPDVSGLKRFVDVDDQVVLGALPVWSH